MKQVTLVVFLCLISGANGFFGISSFFDGSRRAVEDTARVIREQATAIVKTFQRDLVPPILKVLKKVDNVADVIIAAFCFGLFCVVSMMKNNFNDTFLNVYLHILRSISLISSVAVILCMTFNYFFKEKVLSSAETFMYFVVYPALLVVVWNLMKILWFIFCVLCNVVYYFLMLPWFCFYVTVVGPVIWIKGAYQYSKISESNTAFYITISLPWSSAVSCLMAFNVVTTVKPDANFRVAAIYLAIAATYIYVYINAFFCIKNINDLPHEINCVKFTRIRYWVLQMYTKAFKRLPVNET